MFLETFYGAYPLNAVAAFLFAFVNMIIFRVLHLENIDDAFRQV